ncbi:MAG: helix-turn-helix domain-containing protein [Bryobacterales bacterium]|nr:helix-turn-helix domain-containing protein [Bryobacterales bacterium]
MQSPIPENRVDAGSKPSGTPPREILDIKAAAIYLGVSRSHLSHLLAGKIPGLPAIPHVRAGRRALIRRAVIDNWLLQQEHGPAIGVAR